MYKSVHAMPHLSGTEGAEIQTVELITADISAGNDAGVAIDAQEPRAIVGYSTGYEDIGGGDDVFADSRLYLGVDPGGPTVNVAEDHGGKFLDRSHIQHDATNGLVWENSKNEAFLEADHAFDWNEDVTLSLNLKNSGSSSGSVRGTARVYYVEMDEALGI